MEKQSPKIVKFDQEDEPVKKKKSLLNFSKLDDDFEVPSDDWNKMRTMGSGAYGKVMECFYKPMAQSFAIKRFE